MLHAAPVVSHGDAVIEGLAALAFALLAGTAIFTATAAVLLAARAATRPSFCTVATAKALLLGAATLRGGLKQGSVSAHVRLDAQLAVELDVIKLLDGNINFRQHGDALARIERILHELADSGVERFARIVEARNVLVLRKELGGRTELEHLTPARPDADALRLLWRHARRLVFHSTRARCRHSESCGKRAG